MRPAAMELGLLLRQTHRQASQSLGRALAPLGISSRHFGVLMLLERDGTSTQRDLVNSTGGDKAGMQRTIIELETMALIRREADAGDRRVMNLTITDAGRHLFADARRAASSVADELTAELDDAELDQLLALLQRIRRRG
ncbi:MarR family winged helix-turn-helix transcriptional regulator [Humibacter ginsenosidimutans]|nr:MarR family transcriptional regulator [Humibacter ginsenosidimutans]